MEEAFMGMKVRLSSAPVLPFTDFEATFIVETDASSAALRAVLARKGSDGRAQPIHYASRTMTKTEKIYAICEREALAVIFGRRKFRHHLFETRNLP